MDKLKEATALQMCLSEKRMNSIVLEDNESQKMLHELKEVILDRSRQEVEGLRSQLDFLRLVNQNKMSIYKLQEEFEKQISIAEKQCESFQDRKNHIDRVLNDIIEMGNLVLKSLHGETAIIKLNYDFLCLGHQLVEEEVLVQSRLESNKSVNMEIAELSLSIDEMQKRLCALEAKKFKLEEEDIPVHDEVVDTLDRVDVKFEDKSDPVYSQNLMEKINDEVRPSLVTQIIQIDDDSTEVSCYSEEGEEVSSGITTTPTSIMAKATRKQLQHLRTRCNQTELCHFLSSLEGEKRRVIEKSIFKPFLSIPSRKICLSFLHAFIERYNVRNDSFTIDKKAMHFCGKEVEACLGLKFEGRLVDFTTKIKKTPRVIIQYFGTDGRITKDTLMKKLKQMYVNKENADDFFRLSVYFMFSVYFFSTADAYVSYWPVRYLENLEIFRTFGWGRAVYQYLMESVRKTANECAEKVSSYTYVKGCLPLLETLVYERVGSSYLKVEVDPRFPYPAYPSIIKYAKGDSRSPITMKKVLDKVKFDKIKDCEDCLKEITTPMR